jgi:chromosome partitioning protein
MRGREGRSNQGKGSPTPPAADEETIEAQVPPPSPPEEWPSFDPADEAAAAASTPATDIQVVTEPAVEDPEPAVGEVSEAVASRPAEAKAKGEKAPKGGARSAVPEQGRSGADLPSPVIRPADEAEIMIEDTPAGAYVPRPCPRIIAVANQKGGVGKTTTAVNLGAALAEIGFRVLVVDLDPQGNATTGLGIDARTFELSMYDVIMRDVDLEDAIEPTSMKNLFVAPATIDLAGAEIELVPSFSREMKLKKALESIIDDFDFVLIDCPPSLGLITINGLAAAGEVLVPIQCEYYALEGLGQLLRNVHLVQSNLNESLEVSTIVLTMYDGRTKLAEQVADEVRTHFGAKVCRNVIPRTVRISEAPSFGQPITVYDPSSRGAISYRALAKEVSGGTA